MTVPLKKELYKEFSDAVQHTEKMVAEEGFSILMTKSIDEILKKYRRKIVTNFDVSWTIPQEFIDAFEEE